VAVPKETEAEMERRIVGFLLDAEGDWVAEIDCGHRQHVRHRSPFQLRPWVLDDAERAAHLGTPIDCPLCDQGEMPERVRLSRRSPDWDDRTCPRGLLRDHKLRRGTWGRLVVEEGSIHFRARSSPPIDRVVEAGGSQAIAPEIAHEIEPAEGVRFFVEFLDVLPPESSEPAD
jgi:tellurite methyltransferase